MSPSRAGALTLAAPNAVVISPGLVTSGQPPAQVLATLAAQGFEAVIYLAPFSVDGAVPAEPGILQRQGIPFVHIPIPFDAPQPAHVQAVNAALERFAGRMVLVHCQINLRASSIVFLYRVLIRKEPPAEAYEAVARVWSPSGPWRQLIVDQLQQHGIEFLPY
ncbi:MAG: protein tyrosine phosphatase family protein [Pseudomonadota bacterium]|nr:protein tyrosine phosphatase family protein [Pseudomonadota bacterium]